MGVNPVDEMEAEILKAVGHPTRLRIVKFLKNGERAVSEIVNGVGAEQSNVSRHLALLKQAGVVRSRKEGLRVYYRMSVPGLTAGLACMFGCARDVARARVRANESLLAEDRERRTSTATGGE